MSRHSTYELLNQDVVETKKNKAWHVGHAKSMLNYFIGDSFSQRIQEIAEGEQLYLATPVEKLSVTSPYGFDLGEDYETYPLVEGIIDDIIGRYLSRPLKRKSYSINKDAINLKLDTKVDYLIEDIFREVNEKINKEADLNLETENPDIELPENVEEFFSKDYKTDAEELSDDLITQFLDVNGYKDRIKMLLTEYAFGDTCACYFDEKDGHPELVRLRYDECFFDINPEVEVQKDMEVFSFFRFKSENEIYNENNLSKGDRQKVKEAFIRKKDGTLNFDNLDTLDYASNMYQNSSKGVSYKGWFGNGESSNRLRVLTMTWKSRRKIKSLSHTDKRTGRQKTKLLADDYKERNRDVIDVTEVETVHYVKMLGPEIVLDWGEVEERNSRIDNPAKATINSLAIVGKSFLRGSHIRSVAKKLEGLQEHASNILFQIKLMINSIDGRVLIYDAAQTPKQFIDSHGSKNAINRVFHHMKKDKAVIINSADKKDRHTFNQFTSLDLSNRGLMKDLIDALMLVEDLARKYVGLTKEAQQGGEQYQTATAVNRSIIAANTRIEVYFEPFDNFMGALFNKYLQKAKVVYPKGKIFSMIFGDMQSKFFTMHKDIFDADIGVYIGDTSKDLRDKQIIDRGAEMALSNAQDPSLILDLINVLEKDNASESKSILERSVNAMKKLQEQQQQQAMEQEGLNRDADVEKQRKESEEKKLDRENDLDVAKIYANNKMRTNQDNIDSSNLQTVAKLETELEKTRQTNENKQKAESN